MVLNKYSKKMYKIVDKNNNIFTTAATTADNDSLINNSN